MIEWSGYGLLSMMRVFCVVHGIGMPVEDINRASAYSMYRH